MQVQIHTSSEGVVINNLTEQEVRELFQQRNMLLNDMGDIKDGLFVILKKIGLMDEENNVVDKPSMTKLVPKLMGYIGNLDKVTQDFGFLVRMKPMVDRYKDLKPVTDGE